ncbi:MAG: hypothetical protein IKL89_07555 [Clostridia bacterium]|nr:hypothetical protein [Clostridia bacterium]
MRELLQYKCPCCDGAIEFDSTLQKMKCPWCGTDFDVDTLRAFDEELQKEPADAMKWDTAAGTAWQQEECDGLRRYICNSCGGEIVGDKTLAATACPFCGNPTVIADQFRGELRPDFVIPFKLDKKAAVAALRKHYLGKRLLPRAFKDENHITEVKGIYVPFWLFDADADAYIRYKATRVRFWSDASYDYTETSHFSVTRAGSLGFDRVPVDGSAKMDDALMESFEPYDFSEAVDFRTAYLSGYLADIYDIGAEESAERAGERIRTSTEAAFASTVSGYSSCVPVSTRIALQNSSAKYALFPVWLLNTKWEGKVYTFAMNGQTGRFVGDLPMDKKAFFKWLFGITGITAAILFALSYLLWML